MASLGLLYSKAGYTRRPCRFQSTGAVPFCVARMLMCVIVCLCRQEEDAGEVAHGRRPRRRAAVSASKSLQAARNSPDGPSGDDDEYQGDSDVEAAEAASDDLDVDSPTDGDEDM